MLLFSACLNFTGHELYISLNFYQFIYITSISFTDHLIEFAQNILNRYLFTFQLIKIISRSSAILLSIINSIYLSIIFIQIYLVIIYLSNLSYYLSYHISHFLFLEYLLYKEVYLSISFKVQLQFLLYV